MAPPHTDKLYITQTQYFKIYHVSELATLQTASCQRLLNADRVETLKNDLIEQLQQNNYPVLPQCLCVAKTPSSSSSHQQEKEYLIDGQHRLSAYLKVLEELHVDLTVCVNVIEVSKEEEIERLFRLVNESLPLAQLPDGISFADTNHITNHYLKTYSGLFSTCKSGKPRKPRIHQTSFEEFVGRLIEENPTMNVMETIDQFNLQCKGKVWTYFRRSSSDTEQSIQTHLRKCNGFYLGMFDSDEWEALVLGRPVEICITRYKKKISKALKTKVWDRYIGITSKQGNCPFCNTVITTTNFHCAHDVSEARGGDANVDNLYPCCASCNLSMGQQSFEQFLQTMRGIEIEMNE